MTTTPNTVDALMALAKECGATVYAHRTSPHEPAVAFSPSAWEAFSARALAAVPAPPLTMTGYQLREALEFLAPDGTAEQFEQEVCIQHGPERVCDAGTPDETTDPAGLYCWLSDCPEEGSIALTGEDARIRLETAPIAQQAGGVPAGFVLVPLSFVQGFHTLAHNYSLRAVPPDYYRGVEGDAFSAAYKRCGEDLAKLRAMLAAAPSPSAAQPLSEAQIEPMSEWRAEKMAGDWIADEGMGAVDLIRRVENFHGIITHKEPT